MRFHAARCRLLARATPRHYKMISATSCTQRHFISGLYAFDNAHADTAVYDSEREPARDQHHTTSSKLLPSLRERAPLHYYYTSAYAPAAIILPSTSFITTIYRICDISYNKNNTSAFSHYSLRPTFYHFPSPFAIRRSLFASAHMPFSAAKCIKDMGAHCQYFIYHHLCHNTTLAHIVPAAFIATGHELFRFLLRHAPPRQAYFSSRYSHARSTPSRRHASPRSPRAHWLRCFGRFSGDAPRMMAAFAATMYFLLTCRWLAAGHATT